MILEMFPNRFVEILLGVIKDHPDQYKLVSSVANGDDFTDIELTGINQPYDLLELGIRIGIDYSDRYAIERILPEVINIVKKEDITEQVRPSIN